MVTYPIPQIPVDDANGELLLDVGFRNWGLWSVSAARKGWRVIGIEPYARRLLWRRSVLFPARVSDVALGLRRRQVPAVQARPVPLRVLHIPLYLSISPSRTPRLRSAKMGRVLRHGGFAKIQMAHKGGPQIDLFADPPPLCGCRLSFRVRYWSLAAMLDAFEKNIGPTRLLPEAFGGLGLLAEDRDFVSAKAKVLNFNLHRAQAACRNGACADPLGRQCLRRRHQTITDACRLGYEVFAARHVIDLVPARSHASGAAPDN